MGLFGKLFHSEPEKYSPDWLKSLSDTQWEDEREKVRQRHCRGEEGAQEILYRFDDEYRRRNDDGKPWTPPAHSEHGLYLSEDD